MINMKLKLVTSFFLILGLSFAWSNSVYDVDTIGDRTANGYGITYYNNITYFVYTNGLNNNGQMYARWFNHSSGQFSERYQITSSPNDHYYGCLLMDNDGYFHLVYGARPYPAYYVKSLYPYNISSLKVDTRTNPPIYIDPSLTYPRCAMIDNKIYVMMRKGNAFDSSLMLYEIVDKIVTKRIQISKESQEFVAYPVDITKTPSGNICFLFNYRDTNLTSTYNIYPSIRDFMSVLCTDGTNFFDINGNPVTMPLDPENYFTLPRIITGIPYVQDSKFYNETTNYYFNITNDGAYAEFTIIPKEFDNIFIVFRDDDFDVVSATIFNTTGQIITTDNTTLVYVSDYDVNKIHTLRFKYYFSVQAYRLWIDGKPAGVYKMYGYPSKNRTSINEFDIYPYSEPYISLEIGKDYKLSGGSICYDKDNVFNLFFMSRDDNVNKIQFNLMHLRNDNIKQISNPKFSIAHPSCYVDDKNLYVAVEYFVPNMDSSYESYYGMFGSTGEVYLLNSSDYNHWEERPITYATEDGNYAPSFMKPFSSPFYKPFKEIVWTARNTTDISQSKFKFTYFINLPTQPQDPIKSEKLIKIE